MPMNNTSPVRATCGAQLNYFFFPTFLIAPPKYVKNFYYITQPFFRTGRNNYI